MKLYIAGPMTGLPEYNFPAFFTAEDALRDVGYQVMNPARYTTNLGPITDETVAKSKRWDIRALSSVDGVAFLDGWEMSEGACLEREVAIWLGLPVYPLKTWVSYSQEWL